MMRASVYLYNMIRPDLQAPKNNLSVAIPNYCGWSKLSSGMLTLYDSGGGGGFKSPPPLRFFALTHLILELHYCALVTFPKK